MIVQGRGKDGEPSALQATCWNSEKLDGKDWHSKEMLQEHQDVITMSWWAQDTHSGTLGKEAWFCDFLYELNSRFLTTPTPHQNHSSSLWPAQRTSSILCRLKIYWRKRGRKRGESKEGERQHLLSGEEDVRYSPGMEDNHLTGSLHFSKDVHEFSVGIDSFSSVFLWLIEFGLQIKLFVPLSFLMTIPRHSIPDLPQS